ncbi:MAG: hypothetical protein H3C68_08415 [Deltaproteobacteria bacterium]|nr:hypothetical protein [Deltaproteobacteria bacterium]MBZ0219391.1 hypothetical protein [Deltaproteobacteria bacterium]
MKILRPLLTAVIAACMVLIGAVSYLSLKEIDYFKSSYPVTFTVEEAFYASLVEFIKIHIISLPLIAAILLCLYALWVIRE